jgi:hypothetical protein
MTEAGTPLARYSFTSGALRGTQLALHPTCLVHRSHDQFETLPLTAICALRVAFLRDTGKLGWGITLIVIALVMLAIAGPIASWASSAASPGQQPIPAMQAIFRAIEAVASLMPVAALACVIVGGALCALGWIGGTQLLVSLPGAERLYATRGRDTMLLDFAEALSERLMQFKR